MISLEAVIEIGSTGIRLTAGEITGLGSWNVIDHSETAVSIGWDVFTTGSVSRETVLQCLRILKRYREQLHTWDIEESHIQVIATSALREAKNRDMVLDRIFVKTGFRVRVIDGIEENRLMYIAVLDSLKDQLPRVKQTSSVILEIGGGSTEIMLTSHGKMAAVHSLRLGTVIIEQNMKAMDSSSDVRRFLEEFIGNTGMSLNTEINITHIQTFIALGNEPGIVARAIGTQLNEHLWQVERGAYNDFVDQVQNYSTEECMARFNVSYTEAKALGVGLLAYKLFLNLTGATELLYSDTSIRDGVILSRISVPNAELQQEFFSQIVASARNLGKKYHFDENHANHVRENALKLFDTMRGELGLNDYHRRLLEIVALLHDIGMFIRGSDHHLHSQYIIAHSDIFGLSKEDMAVVSLAARYHRGAVPSQSDEGFSSLSRAERVVVLKLAAIIRVADALDRSHMQTVINFTPELRGDTLVLHMERSQDVNLEKVAIAEKGDLFESIFGYKVLIA